jgi:hypothetical protein
MLGLMSGSEWIAIAAVVASLVGVMFASTMQQRIAREARRHARLQDTYVTLTDYALRTRQYALTAMPKIGDDHPLRAPPFSDEDWLVLRARVLAYASDAVRKLFEEVQTTRVRTAGWLEDWRAALERGPSESFAERQEGLKDLEELRLSRDRLAELCNELVERVRFELRGGK